MKTFSQFVSKFDCYRNLNEEVAYTPKNDYEGEMALSQLRNIASKSQELVKMIENDSKMEAWVQSKITLADDYITTVYDYIKNTPGTIQK